MELIVVLENLNLLILYICTTDYTASYNIIAHTAVQQYSARTASPVWLLLPYHDPVQQYLISTGFSHIYPILLYVLYSSIRSIGAAERPPPCPVGVPNGTSASTAVPYCCTAVVRYTKCEVKICCVTAVGVVCAALASVVLALARTLRVYSSKLDRKTTFWFVV